jgi:hypothetical protein
VIAPSKKLIDEFPEIEPEITAILYGCYGAYG